MVFRTYTTGISLRHYPRDERGKVKKKLSKIVKQLSDENFIHCQKYSQDVINHLVDHDISEHKIMNLLPKLEGSRGKYAVNTIMTDIGVASNHLHSGYHQLLTSAKGFIDRINKVREMFSFMEENPKEFTSWILWGRSTYTLKYFSMKWNISFWYLDNIMRGVHHKYFESLPCFLREISREEFDIAIDVILEEFPNEELTDRQKIFMKKLHKLREAEIDLSFIPTGWKHLKLWLDNLDYHRNYMSVFRAIFSQVYLLDYSGMINKIMKTARITDMLAIPFQNKKIKKISHLIVSGPKYVIRRNNNKQSLEDMRNTGYFELKFKMLEETWNDAITTRIYPSRKMRQLLGEKITLKSQVLLPPRSNDVDIQLVFQGKLDVFIATKHLKDRLPGIKPRDKIGIDINRRGEYAVASNIDTTMPEDIQKLSERWDDLLEQIAHLQFLKSKAKNRKKRFIYDKQITDLYECKKRYAKLTI